MKQLIFAALFLSSSMVLGQTRAEIERAVALASAPQVVASYQEQCLADGSSAPKIEYGTNPLGFAAMIASIGAAALSNTPDSPSGHCNELDSRGPMRVQTLSR